MMSVKTRAAWMEHIDKINVSPVLKKEMKGLVHKFDNLLSHVIGQIELNYLREKQKGHREVDDG